MRAQRPIHRSTHRASARCSTGCGWRRTRGCRYTQSIRTRGCWSSRPRSAPAARRRATIVASAAAGGAEANSEHPNVVGRPATSVRSFTSSGNPASGPARRAAIEGVGFRERLIAAYADDGVEDAVRALDAPQRRLDQLPRRDALLAHGLRQFGQHERKVCQAGSRDTVRACRSPSPTPTASSKASRARSSRTPGRAPRRARCSTHPTRSCPTFWDELVELGWLGLHLPEDDGGSGLRPARARRRARGARARRSRPGRSCRRCWRRPSIATAGTDAQRPRSSRPRRRQPARRARARRRPDASTATTRARRRRRRARRRARRPVPARRRRRHGRRRSPSAGRDASPSREPRPDPPQWRASCCDGVDGRRPTRAARRAPRSPATSRGRSSPPRPPAARRSASTARASTPRSASSSAARSRCSRR